jgi:hypothetical protein
MRSSSNFWPAFVTITQTQLMQRALRPCCACCLLHSNHIMAGNFILHDSTFQNFKRGAEFEVETHLKVLESEELCILTSSNMLEV